MVLKGWSNLVSSMKHIPLTWNLTKFLVICFLAQNLPDLAIVTLLSFDCMFRISELLNLHYDDFLPPGDSRRVNDTTGKTILRLRKTKTSKILFIMFS